MTKEDEESSLVPAPVTTYMYQDDMGMVMPWVRWFQQFRKGIGSIVVGRAKLPGVQAAGVDLLDTPCVVRLPGYAKASVYTAEGECFIAPVSSAYEADITWKRPPATSYTSIFYPGQHLVIPVGETSAIPVEPKITDFKDGDLFNVDVISADGTCSGVELTIRGAFLRSR